MNNLKINCSYFRDNVEIGVDAWKEHLRMDIEAVKAKATDIDTKNTIERAVIFDLENGHDSVVNQHVYKMCESIIA